MKIRPVGAELFNVDGHDETNSHFAVLRTRLKNRKCGPVIFVSIVPLLRVPR
jgi:hypothetical protein